jgi:hypothetical protein
MPRDLKLINDIVCNEYYISQRDLVINWCFHLLSIQIMGHVKDICFNFWTFNSPHLLNSKSEKLNLENN